MGLRRRREPPLDPFERAARRSDPELAKLHEVPDLGGLAGVNRKNLLLAFVLLVVVVAFVRDGAGRGGPQLAKSCSRAAYKLSTTDVPRFGVVRWSAAGPADSSVVFALDSTTVPAPRTDALLAGPLPLTGCLRSGLFGVRAPAGEHKVTALLVRPDGTSTVLGTSTLTVNDP